jgi:4-amino-4-deoxychorismate lyase
MNAVFNGSSLEVSSVPFDINNRAFLYGDGLFETIIVKDNSPNYLQDHLDRLHRGMKILKMKISSGLQYNPIQESIEELLKANNFKDARIKLIVWRKPGGLYIPESEESEYLILCNALSQNPIEGRRTDFCSSITLQESIFSEFKRLNSLPFVLAGIELKEKGLDDLILLDDHGNVAECISSNIFWKSGKEYFTPSLDTGCIAGVRRKNIIERLKSLSIPIHQIKSLPNELIKADCIFSTNVAGIYPIIQIGEKKFSSRIPDLV